AVVAGSNVTVTLTVRNGGTDGATDVVLNSTLTGGLSLVSAIVSQGTVSQDGALVRAELGELASGSNATLNLQVRADQLGVWTNAAVVTAAEFDPDLTENSVTNLIQVQPDADLSVALTATPNPVLVQGSLTYKISLTNLGPHTATGVRLVETLSGSLTNDQNVVRYELGDLPVGSNS